MSVATLDGVDLPCHFKYTPLTPKRRVYTKPTAGGVVFQRSATPVIGQGEIPFVMTAPSILIAEEFCKHHLSTLGAIVFTGYYGDSYEVEILDMSVKVEGGIFYIEGSFQVLCTLTPFCPSC